MCVTISVYKIIFIVEYLVVKKEFENSLVLVTGSSDALSCARFFYQVITEYLPSLVPSPALTTLVYTISVEL